MAKQWQSTVDLSAVAEAESAAEMLRRLAASWGIECLINDVNDEPGRTFPAASFPGPTLEHLMVMPVASRRAPLTIMWQKAVAAAGHSAAPVGLPPPAPALGPDARPEGNPRRTGKISVRHSPVALRSPALSSLMFETEPGSLAAGEGRPARGADDGGRQDPRRHRVPAVPRRGRSPAR